MNNSFLIFADTEAEAIQWAVEHKISPFEYQDPANVDPELFTDGTYNVIILKSN